MRRRAILFLRTLLKNARIALLLIVLAYLTLL